MSEIWSEGVQLMWPVMFLLQVGWTSPACGLKCTSVGRFKEQMKTDHWKDGSHLFCKTSHRVGDLPNANLQRLFAETCPVFLLKNTSGLFEMSFICLTMDLVTKLLGSRRCQTWGRRRETTWGRNLERNLTQKESGFMTTAAVLRSRGMCAMSVSCTLHDANVWSYSSITFSLRLQQHTPFMSSLCWCLLCLASSCDYYYQKSQ